MKKYIIIIFTFFIVFAPIVALQGQSWETFIPSIKNNYEDYEIGALHNGIYTIAGLYGKDIIVLNENGNILSLRKMSGDIRRLKVYENTIYALENGTDTISMLIISNKGQIIEKVNLSIYDKTIRSFVVQNDNSFFAISTGGELFNFRRNGTLINSIQTSTNANLTASHDGRIAVTRSGTPAQFIILNDSLETIFSINNLDIGPTLVWDVDFGPQGKVYFTGNNGVNGNRDYFNVGVLDSLGNLLHLASYKQPFAENFNLPSWPFNIVSNGNMVGVLLHTVESNENLHLYCLDSTLAKQDSFIRFNGGFLSNMVANADGGFVFGFGESTNPQEDPFSVDKRPIFFSTNDSCSVVARDGFIKGSVFEDVNSNGIQDQEENFYPNLKILHLPDSIYTYSNDSGYYQIRVSEGFNSLEIVDYFNCFGSIDPFVFDADTITFQKDYNFLLTPIASNQDLVIHVNSNRVRCGFTIPFVFTAENTGCSPINGTMNVLPNSLLEFVDTADSQKDIINLLPYQKKDIVINFKVAGEEFDGNTTLINVVFAGSGINIDSSHYNVISCAIDPNDKIVSPVEVDPDKNVYAEIGSEYFYTIRFQNLGSDTAFTVVIVDTLSNKLDNSSIRPISSSHSFNFEQRNKELKFKFSNILLPPAIDNEELSNGFVTFSARSNAELTEFSMIENFADIYFDFNKPIRTNVSSFIAVEKLDADSDDYFFWEDCNDFNNLINLNAEEIANNNIDENCDGEILIIDEDKDGFNSDEDCNDLNNLINPDAEEIANNNIDENCDGEILIIDEDMDGFNSTDDCDDRDNSIYPMAPEIANNGIDEDCNGEDLVSSSLEIVIASKLLIYPNPNSGNFYLVSNYLEKRDIQIFRSDGSLYGMFKLVKEQKLEFDKLEPGFYLVKVLANSRSSEEIHKVLIQK